MRRSKLGFDPLNTTIRALDEHCVTWHDLQEHLLRLADRNLDLDDDYDALRVSVKATCQKLESELGRAKALAKGFNMVDVQEHLPTMSPRRLQELINIDLELLRFRIPAIIGRIMLIRNSLLHHKNNSICSATGETTNA